MEDFELGDFGFGALADLGDLRFLFVRQPALAGPLDALALESLEGQFVGRFHAEWFVFGGVHGTGQDNILPERTPKMRHAVVVLLLAGSLGCATVPHPVARRVIATDRAPAALAAYSQAIQVGDTVWVAGQLGTDPATRQLVSGGIEAETRQALENVRVILEAAGFTLADAVQVQVLLADIADWEKLNPIYVTFFPQDPPARAAYAVAALPRGARVEIVVTASRTRP